VAVFGGFWHREWSKSASVGPSQHRGSFYTVVPQWSKSARGRPLQLQDYRIYKMAAGALSTKTGLGPSAANRPLLAVDEQAYTITALNLLAFPRDRQPICELTGMRATVQLACANCTLFYATDELAEQVRYS
jgi:hypothetical protein